MLCMWLAFVTWLDDQLTRPCSTAHNSALFALDLVSLLLTKESPTGAGLTLRQDLRDLVGIGTLASQKHAESNVTKDKLSEYGEVTAGWNILAIDETRESAQKVAELLDNEIDKEARYWADILSVSERGWSVCRLPREKDTLGVRFGFNEGRATMLPIFNKQLANALQLPPSSRRIVWRLCAGLPMAPLSSISVFLGASHSDSRSPSRGMGRLLGRQPCPVPL